MMRLVHLLLLQYHLRVWRMGMGGMEEKMLLVVVVMLLVVVVMVLVKLTFALMLLNLDATALPQAERLVPEQLVAQERVQQVQQVQHAHQVRMQQ